MRVHYIIGGTLSTGRWELWKRARAWYHCARGGRMLCTYFIHRPRTIKSMNECWCREAHEWTSKRERERRSFALSNQSYMLGWVLISSCSISSHCSLCEQSAKTHHNILFNATSNKIARESIFYSCWLSEGTRATSLNRTRCTPPGDFPISHFALTPHHLGECQISSTRFAIIASALCIYKKLNTPGGHGMRTIIWGVAAWLTLRGWCVVFWQN